MTGGNGRGGIAGRGWRCFEYGCGFGQDVGGEEEVVAELDLIDNSFDAAIIIANTTTPSAGGVVDDNETVELKKDAKDFVGEVHIYPDVIGCCSSRPDGNGSQCHRYGYGIGIIAIYYPGHGERRCRER